MKLQKLLSYIRRAVDDYDMIQNRDKIAVGVSGGKDSLTLLYALHALQQFYPKSFDIEAITVDLGFENLYLDGIRRFCEDLCVHYTIVSTQINQIVFDERKEKHPCSLCAKLRKGAINDAAASLGCQKIAYGHHLDDLVETMLLSLLYEGRLHTFSPVTYLDRTQLTVIRPLIYIHEAEIKGFQNKYQLPVCKNTCPADGQTRRAYVKDLLARLNQENPGVTDRIFTAARNAHLDGL